MKCFAILITVLSLLLSGCGFFTEHIKEPVTFYYLRSEFQYFTQDSVIATEEREASGHRDDLSYLMALYLMGPAEEELVSPIPRGTRIYRSEETEDAVNLYLSDTATTMDDMEFTLACSCLALTCLDLTEAPAVTITSGERTITMNRDTLTLFDGSTAALVEENK